MKYLFYLLIITGCSQSLVAQDENQKLNIPSTPAFSILNFEPSAVMRPTTNKDLAADILNSFDKEGKLLMNLGLEVTPYWLQSRPKLTRKQYLEPRLGQTILQSLSLSAATVKDSSSGNNKLGAGFRFKMLNGSPVDELKQADEELLAEATIISNIAAARSMVGVSIRSKQAAIDFVVTAMTAQNFNQTTIKKFKQDAENLAPRYGDTDGEIKVFLESLASKRLDDNEESIKKNVDLTYQRKGLIVEIAGASGFNFSDKNNFDRAGIWANASQYVSPDDNFTVTARYMFQNNDSSITNFDVGLGYLKQTSKYNISVESMVRWYRAEIPDFNSNNEPIKRLEKDFTYRLAVQFSFMLGKDISINAALGKDFNSPFISGSGFFSILGFNYSIFNKERVAISD